MPSLPGKFGLPAILSCGGTGNGRKRERRRIAASRARSDKTHGLGPWTATPAATSRDHKMRSSGREAGLQTYPATAKVLLALVGLLTLARHRRIPAAEPVGSRPSALRWAADAGAGL